MLLSVGSEPTPQAYFERGALFYNALTEAKVALGLAQKVMDEWPELVIPADFTKAVQHTSPIAPLTSRKFPDRYP